MKMEQTECSETSEYKTQMPGNYPEESIQHSEHGKSLKSRSICFLHMYSHILTSIPHHCKLCVQCLVCPLLGEFISRSVPFVQLSLSIEGIYVQFAIRMCHVSVYLYRQMIYHCCHVYPCYMCWTDSHNKPH